MKARVKRMLDLFLVAASLPLVVPLLLTVAVLVRLKLGPPILFRQARAGWRGEIFELIKFRSMSAPAEPGGLSSREEERLSEFGRWLRSTSLDELPELINVLKGEMSLVGPRPLLPEYLPFYSPNQAQRHAVLPGLTGLAQTSGRNSLSWEERFQLDAWYVENWSVWLDLRILLLTVLKVWKRDGISADGGGMMPAFNDEKVGEP